jgi:hypothetical protein
MSTLIELSNNALQRTNGHRGRPVRALNRVRGPGRNSALAAAEQDR